MQLHQCYSRTLQLLLDLYYCSIYIYIYIYIYVWLCVVRYSFVCLSSLAIFRNRPFIYILYNLHRFIAGLRVTFTVQCHASPLFTLSLYVVVQVQTCSHASVVEGVSALSFTNLVFFSPLF